MREEVWEAPNQEVAHKAAMEIDHEYRSLAPRAMRIFRRGLPQITIHLRHDKNDRVACRTTNITERWNGEIKRFTKKVRYHPTSGSLHQTEGLCVLKHSRKQREKAMQKTGWL
nr:transposase [Pasteuria penetrans]